MPTINMPPRIARLPMCPKRNIPVPWFVSWIDGVPEFRCADGEKRVRAVREKLCWVCGDVLGRHMTAVVGPMCGINRTTAEPPCHLECARFSVINCPFLSRPHAKRRENDMPEEGTVDGHMIKRNPGVTLLWTMRDYSLFSDGLGGWLIQLGEPTVMEWWAEGKIATRAQVVESVESGIPILQGMCQGSDDVEELMRRKAWLETKYPE